MLLPLSPMSSLTPAPSITPGASLPLSVVPPYPRCRREGTHRSDAAAWYGWLRQRMECPQPWPMAPHASAALWGSARAAGWLRAAKNRR